MTIMKYENLNKHSELLEEISNNDHNIKIAKEGYQGLSFVKGKWVAVDPKAYFILFDDKKNDQNNCIKFGFKSFGEAKAYALNLI